MCGLTGILDLQKKITKDNIISFLSLMSKEIEHRGPDNFSYWADNSVNIALGFQRLSIQDISSRGNQPMISICKRYVIIFNGEIYNFKQLKEIFLKKGIYFKSNSDTEVFLCCITHYGLDKSLELVHGMFAFALWDAHDKVLHLARDRVGEKPIYYGWQDNYFIFASELKALKKFPKFKKSISKKAVDFQVNLSYVPAPYSIYEDIYKLMPGSFLSIKIKSNFKCKNAVKISNYWSPQNIIKKKLINENPIKKLENLLIKSIKNQLISDVPLGVFLSGGIDSSLIASLAQSISINKVDSFSIGFEEKEFNEAKYSRNISKYLNTNHNELVVTSKDALKIIPNISYIYDEPFSDPSQIPTIILSKFAKQKITAVLTGDGGDEIFGGYNRHMYGPQIFNRFIKLPKTVQKVIKFFLKKMPDFFYSFLSSVTGISETKEKAQKILNAFNAKTLLDLYIRLISSTPSANSKIVYFNQNDEDFTSNFEIIGSLTDEEQLMFWDLIFYLPNNVLTKVDRASMSCSLEARAPFLDHSIIEYGLNLDKKYKIQKGVNKWILKKILGNYVPLKYFNRPKSGFTIPLKLWLKGPLKEWANNLLNEKRIRNEGFLNYKVVDKILREHQSGKTNSQYQLWNILMFQSWLERWN